MEASPEITADTSVSSDVKSIIKKSKKKQNKESEWATEEINESNTNTHKKRKCDEMEVDITENEDNKDNTEDAVAAPIFPADKKQKRFHKEERRISVPQHRLTPLKKNWTQIFTPLVENLKLNVRFNTRTRQVELKTGSETEDINIQKGADFVQAFVYGFDVNDALALVRLHDLYLETFDVKDVKRSVAGDHMGRAIGRLAGKGGKTRFTLENHTKTRIVIADSRIHILGAFDNIAQARKAISCLIMGSPPSKVFGNLRAYSSKLSARM